MEKLIPKKRLFVGRLWQRANELIQRPRFPAWYALLAVAVLAATTLVWSILGASLQNANSDQLANSYLFQHSSTFHQATLPGTHTFLLKWPLFLLIRLFGLSGGAIAFFSVLTSLITVSGLAFILYKIERRPLVFGTLCLALASALLLVPPMPYAGGLLPVNMAMLATRNIEYLVYMLSLILILRAPGLRSRRFWVGVSAMVLLAASDKFFLTLGIGGAVIALVVYALAKNWRWVTESVNWLIGSVAAGIGAIILLALINASGLMHISNVTSGSPYGVVHNLNQLGRGLVYGIGGWLTNFGANPGFDANTIGSIPHHVIGRLVGPAGPEYIVNLLVLLAGLWATVWLVLSSVRHKLQPQKYDGDTPAKLGLALAWSSLIAFAVFVLTDHYYPVDARYLTIGLFAIFVCLASFGRRFRWSDRRLVLSGAVITICMVMGLFSVVRVYSADKSALSDINQRNILVAQVVTQHRSHILVGDYWRVMPIEQASNNKLAVMPLDNCTQARQVLSSRAWQPDLHNAKFAYLLSLDKSLTDYPTCTLKQVISFYGRPNASALIAGTITHPVEYLLFYDHGVNNSSPITPQPAGGPSTVVPITTDELPYTSCTGPTDLDIVAHQDDDLLFMNPDLLHDIKAGRCIRTVYITAGDNGSGKFYWLNREQGSEAAYSYMTGLTNIWVERTVELNDHEFITVANPRGNTKISLIFMHLPDGNQGGNGFPSSNFESLAKLWGNNFKPLQSVDGQSSYTYDDLVNALVTLMSIYNPAEIRTQSTLISRMYPDHSDHMAVGRFVKIAYQKYEIQQFGGEVTIPLKYYIGYPIHALSANVSGADLTVKENAWLNYAEYDGDVCQSAKQCLAPGNVYGIYLQRQYQNPF